MASKYLDYSGLQRYDGLIKKYIDDKLSEPEYVDLGLPSGTLWAKYNVGATSETEYGNYYMYGKGATQYNSSDSAYTGTEDPLDSSVDTAAQVWGGSWHMPTRAQMQELIANTTYQWVTNYKGSGINGGTFTATNGAVLFLPAAGTWDDGSHDDVGNFGDYWGSSPDGSDYAYNLYFYNSLKDVSNDDRKYGYSVRPVHAPFLVSPTKVKDSLGINSSTGSASKYLNEQGSFVSIASDSNKQDKITASGLLKGNGSGTVSAAVAGTDYQAPLTAGTDYVAPVSGKGLSTNDYDNTAKGKVDAIPANPQYTDTTYVFNSTYNASTNKAATMADIPGGIIQAVSGSSVTQQLSPNVFYSFGTMTSLTVTLGSPTSDHTNEYVFEFDSGSTATQLQIPSTVLGIDTTSVEASTHYEVNIKYNATTNKYYGLMYGWEA
jgi:hypothetical protein